MIEVRSLSKIYRVKGREVIAVQNVDFQIEEGEVLGLVGESGCGKSTLAKLLMRLERPTSGSFFFDGHEITHNRERSLTRHMQMIFQDPFASLNPRMKVEDLLKEPLIVHRLPVHDAVDKLLNLVGLPNNAKHRFPHEFSGGQRQRIGIARALALNPKFLICDEPISSLDVSIQAQIVALLQALQKELHLTYLFIAHDLAMVRYLSDRIAVMYSGSFVEMAPADELFERPLHPYTQLLIASASRLGAPENPITSEPTGCPFSHRCPHAMPLCRKTKPPLVQIGQSRNVACHLHS